MAWIIIKSAGDDYSFVSICVEDKMGHTYEYANKMAKDVTRAMRIYKDMTENEKRLRELHQE